MKQCIPIFDIFITGVMAFVFHPFNTGYLESQYKRKLSLYRIKLNKMGYGKTIFLLKKYTRY